MKRITYLDMAKGIGIITMVMVHVIGALQGFDNKWFYAPLTRFLVSFTMPVFLIVSGILLFITGEEKKDMKTIIIRKAKGLLIPYAVFSAVFLAIDFFMQPGAFDGRFYLEGAIATLTGRGFSVLWFMPTLFIGEIFFLFCIKKNKPVLGIAAAVIGFVMLLISPVLALPYFVNGSIVSYILRCLLFTVIRGLMAAFFLGVGYLFAFLINGKKIPSLLSLGLGILLMVSDFFLCGFNISIDMNTMVFGNVFIFTACALIGAFGVILICKGLPDIKPLTWIGVNSLVIMLTHQDFLFLLRARSFALWLNRYTTRAKDIIVYVSIFVFIGVLEVLTVHIFNTSFPSLIGKKKVAK